MEKKGIVDKILVEFKQEKDRDLLNVILEKALSEYPEKRAAMQKIMNQVSDEKDRDMLDPEFMKPILFKNLPNQLAAVDSILHDLKVKKDWLGLVPPYFA